MACIGGPCTQRADGRRDDWCPADRDLSLGAFSRGDTETCDYALYLSVVQERGASLLDEVYGHPIIASDNDVNLAKFRAP